MNKMFWEMMVYELNGNKFNNYGLNVLAQTQVGEVKESKEYLLLTSRLYTPTVMERFAAK
jgi:methanogenic corrinoid protein MtbC1